MSKRTVIIVEDDAVLSGVMQNSLQKRGYEVTCASDTEQASNQLQEKIDNRQAAFDLAIVDLKLAKENSLAFLPVLRRSNPAMKILMLTGYASIATAVEAVKQGADNYLPKPASMSEILQALGEGHGKENEGDELSLAGATESLAPLSTKRLEWEHIQRVLHKNDGNISATARELNMHRRTLQRKLQKNPVKD